MSGAFNIDSSRPFFNRLEYLDSENQGPKEVELSALLISALVYLEISVLLSSSSPLLLHRLFLLGIVIVICLLVAYFFLLIFNSFFLSILCYLPLSLSVLHFFFHTFPPSLFRSALLLAFIFPFSL